MIDSGQLRVLARQYSKGYDFFAITISSPGSGRTPLPLSTGDDLNNTTALRLVNYSDFAGTDLAVDDVLQVASDLDAGISDDGGALTDETTDSNSDAADDVVFMPTNPATNDAFYIGMTDPFGDCIINLTTATDSVAAVLTWEYSLVDGSYANRS